MCFTMDSPRENKTMNVCLQDESKNDEFILAMFQFQRCRNGDNLQAGMPLNLTCASLYGDKVLGATGTSTEFGNLETKQMTDMQATQAAGGTTTQNIPM